MASKKQKREAAQAKREAFLAEVKEEGLKAQARDRAQREIEAMRIKEWAEGYNARCNEILRSHGVVD